jgi:amidase
MKGLGVNVAFVGWVGRIAQDDAQLLKCLWDSGANFFARTTQPQTLVSKDTTGKIVF